MNKLIFISIISVMFLFSCATVNTKKEQDEFLSPDIYETLNKRKDSFIVKTIFENNYLIQYYGNDNKLPNYQCGESLGGSSHLVYYKNPGKDYKLYSILIQAKYIGDRDKDFYFTIADFNDNLLYKSVSFKYMDFPGDRFLLKEYILDNINPESDFVVRLTTNSTKENGLYVANIPSADLYCYKYKAPRNYKESENGNWSIFVKYKKVL
jgi:hypothetical protein